MTTSRTWHDPAYLAYLQAITICNPEHLAECVRATGARRTEGLSRELRWPGYVGTNYDKVPIRILCVAQVHHGPILAETGQGIQNILRRICADGASPALAGQLAREYEKVVALWGPWVKFTKVLRGIDLALATPAAVAYVNVAKCWQDPTEASRENCRLPMRTCQAFYPLSKLRQAVKADVVLVLSTSSTLGYAGVPKAEWLFNFPGRPSDAYLAEVAVQVRDFLRASRSN